MADAAKLGRSQRVEGELARWFKLRLDAQQQGHYGPDARLNRTDLAQVGWALVVAEDEDPQVLQALQPLIDHRTLQTPYAKVLRYRPGQRYNTWLAANGVAPGTSMPHLVPYYLLIVGSPDRIPFSFSNPLKIDWV